MFPLPEFVLDRWLKLPVWLRILLAIPLAPLWMLGSAAVMIVVFVAAITVVPLVYMVVWFVTGEEPH